jgi:hypothetical protein
LLMISGLINPYICFMVLGFTLIISLRLCFVDKELSKKELFLYNSLSIAGLLLAWFLVGMMGFKTGEDLSVSGGYGLYSLNLNSLVDSFGFSSFFPALKQVSLHQYEGYMYLGLGIMILIATTITYQLHNLIKNRKREFVAHSMPHSYKVNLIPIISLFVIYTLFSITHIVSLNDRVLFKIPIPDSLTKIGEIFRASARFFWPVYYSIMLFCIMAIAKSRLPRLVKLSIILIALIVQFYDTKRLFTYRHLTYGFYKLPIDERNWNNLIKDFDEIVLYPPFQGSYLVNSDYQYFCYLAAKARKPVTTGYVARVDNKSVAVYADSLEYGLARGEISAKKIYITTAPYLESFSVVLQNRTAQLNILDNYYYIFAKNIDNPKLASLSNTLNARSARRLDSALEILTLKNQFIKTTKIDFRKHPAIRHSVENLVDGNKFISAKGWAFADTTDNNKGDSIFLVLNSNSDSYIAPARIRPRPDVTGYFQKSYLDDAGFDALVFKEDVNKGSYVLGIAIKNSKDEWIYQKTDKIIKVGIYDYAPAEIIDALPSSALIKYNLETIQINNDIVTASGWAYLPDQDNDNCKISLVLTEGEKKYMIETEAVLRPDIASYFKSNYRLDNAGFTVKFRKGSLPTGKYQIGIMIRDLKTRREGIVFPDRSIEIQ